MTVSSQLLGQYPAPLYGVQATKPAVPFCGCVGVLGASRSLTLTQPTLTWLSQHGSLDGLQVQAIRDARHGHGEELPGVRLALDRDGEVPAGTCCSSGAEGGGAREAARGWEVPVRASPQPPAQVLGRLVACPTALRSSTDVASQYAAGSAPNRRRSRVGHVPSPHALSLHAPEQRRWMAHPVRKGGPCRVVAGVQPHAAKRYPRLPVHRSSEGAGVRETTLSQIAGLLILAQTDRFLAFGARMDTADMDDPAAEEPPQYLEMRPVTHTPHAGKVRAFSSSVWASRVACCSILTASVRRRWTGRR